MLHPRTRWESIEVDSSLQTQLSEKLNIHHTIAKMLIRRGMKDIEAIRQFLSPSYEELHDPYLLSGMKEAVERIRRALEKKEKILIYGDYDVDGVSSTSLMIQLFQKLEADVQYYIPNRFREGYGINRQALQTAQQQGFTLVISVDTGISAAAEVEYAKELGLDLIITDHHEPSPILPDTIVINPKQPHCTYPFSQLAGVGVAFKLATALLDRLPEEYLDLVALGTVADLVPLIEENRILVTHGLKKINSQTRIGIQALAEVAEIEQEITESHIGFALGPRINACGRLDSADLAVELLTTEDVKKARMLAEECNRLNQTRQQMVQGITAEAIQRVDADPKRYQHAIVVGDPSWNMGVVGIVASRLVEKYYRPVIVLSIDTDQGIAKGSARSIEGFHIYQALSECKQHLLNFGGHEMAAGMTLEIHQIDVLQDELSRLANEWLQPEDWMPTSAVDDELTLSEVNLTFIQQLEQLAPFGVGNPTPKFVVKGAQIQRKSVVGVHKDTLKLELKENENRLDAIGFQMAQIAEEITPFSESSCLGELQMNEWNGRQTPQLIIRDMKISHPQIFDWRSNNHSKWEKLKKLDQQKCVFFTAKAERCLDGMVVNWRDVEKYISDPQSFKEKKYMVLIDPPPTLQDFHQTLTCFSYVERFYFLYGDQDLDDLWVRVPSRDQFKRFYQTIYQKEQLSLTRHFAALQRRTGLSKRMLLFMIRVFQELGFVTIENNEMRMKSNPPKRPLSDSPYYQEQLAKEEVLQQFIYSSYQELCEYVLTLQGGTFNEFQGKDSRNPRLSHVRSSV